MMIRMRTILGWASVVVLIGFGIFQAFARPRIEHERFAECRAKYEAAQTRADTMLVDAFVPNAGTQVFSGRFGPITCAQYRPRPVR